MLEHIPERFRTPAVARAIASPSAILLSGACVAAAIASGLPLVVAPLAGVAGWATRVALALPRGSNASEISPYSLSEPWRGLVKDAQSARERFDRTSSTCAPGPLKDRLETLGGRIADGVQESWRVAHQGDALHKALETLPIHQIRGELEQVRAERNDPQMSAGHEATLERTEQALAAQVQSYERMRSVSEDARSRLRLLNAQLDEAVARAVELSVHQGDPGALSPLSDDVDNLVGQLEHLRQAMEETSTPNW